MSPHHRFKKSPDQQLESPLDHHHLSFCHCHLLQRNGLRGRLHWLHVAGTAGLTYLRGAPQARQPHSASEPGRRQSAQDHCPSAPPGQTVNVGAYPERRTVRCRRVFGVAVGNQSIPNQPLCSGPPTLSDCNYLLRPPLRLDDVSHPADDAKLHLIGQSQVVQAGLADDQVYALLLQSA